MIEIVKVETNKQKKQFVNFQIKLYKDSKNYVPPLVGDELKIFNEKTFPAAEGCTYEFYLALKDGEVVGRIGAIIQPFYNKKTNEKRVRFTRFDCINDQEVANKLFNSVEIFAKEHGMNIIHGPLGFNDLEREGLLIEGFDEISTFNEQYSYPYYKTLIENYGFNKEVDWVEFELKKPNSIDPRITKISELVLKKYNLKIAKGKSKRKYLNHYKQGIFDVIDVCYKNLYGVVPYNEKVRESLIEQFNLLIDLKYISTVVDENDKVVAFGFVMPWLGDAVRKSKGRLTPLGLVRILKAVKNPKVVECALIAVDPYYQSKGVNAVVLNEILSRLINSKVEIFETNLNLEDNQKIISQWKNFEHRQHKRRRSFIKKLDD